jgi:hypothetical protein
MLIYVSTLYVLNFIHIDHIPKNNVVGVEQNRGTARHPASSKVQHPRGTHHPLLHPFDWAYSTPWLHAHLLVSVCGEDIAVVQLPAWGHGVYTPARNIRGRFWAQDGTHPELKRWVTFGSASCSSCWKYVQKQTLGSVGWRTAIVPMSLCWRSTMVQEHQVIFTYNAYFAYFAYFETKIRIFCKSMQNMQNMQNM